MRLKTIRLEEAMTQQDLEAVSGVTQATISAIESGKRPARPSTVRKLADALGVAPRELMRRDGDE